MKYRLMIRTSLLALILLSLYTFYTYRRPPAPLMSKEAGPFADSQEHRLSQRLEAAERTWRNQHISAYKIRIDRSIEWYGDTFDSQHGATGSVETCSMVARVTGDSSSTYARLLNTGFAEHRCRGFENEVYTVEDMFAAARTWINDTSREEAAIAISFDESYGFPRRIIVEGNPVIEISGFEIIE